MKPLVMLLPWWSFALLFGNIILAGVVLVLRGRHGAFSSLTTFRLYLWYCLASGLVGFAAICFTPVGSSFYWYVVSSINLVFNFVLFLLCAQVIDQAVHRREVKLVKTLWLILPPTILGLVIVLRGLYPFLRIQQSVKFDFACAVASAAVLVFSIIKPSDLRPDELWVRDYKLVIAGLAVQIAATCGVSFWRFPSPAADIFAALASMVTLIIFAVAVLKGSPARRSAMQTAL
jgi:hypothetical protein